MEVESIGVIRHGCVDHPIISRVYPVGFVYSTPDITPVIPNGEYSPK